MNHEVEVSNLMFNKSSDGPIDFKKYDINVDLEEESSNEEKTILKYSLDLTSNPKNSVINISGNATLIGESSEIENFLKQENEKTPEVVSLIYQELFPLMYIITKNMKIPPPSHSISQSQLTESKNNENQVNDDDKLTQQTVPPKEKVVEEDLVQKEAKDETSQDTKSNNETKNEENE